MAGNGVKDIGDPHLPRQQAGVRSPVNASAVRAQLERILASVPFRNSKRYPALLRYVVEKELNGASSELKERTIAIDVFGRDPLYDPGADPVVRISAGEVRKRLAQYYQEAADASELRIELPVGSYHPEFVAPPISLQPVQPVLPVMGQPLVENGPALRSRRNLLAVCLLALCAVLASIALYQWAHLPTGLDLFWRPVIKQNNSVMLVLGRNGFRAEDVTSHAVDPNETAVAWWDAATLARVAGLVESKGASIRLFREDEANFADFQQRPAVVIGAYNDRWTIEWMSRLRYTFRQNGAVQWIADRDRPSFADWKVDLNQKDAQGNLAIGQDYAIISRVSNPRTGFITVTVAGLWGYGTLAAGRFLTDPRFLDDFLKQSNVRLDRGDLQIVIGTEVIQGKAGPPRVLAVSSL